MCKLHGVRLIKGIKIFESMFKSKSIFVSKKALITISAVIENLQPKCGLSLFYKENLMYK